MNSLLLLPLLLGAEPGDAAITEYLQKRTKDLSGQFMNGATTLDAWEKQRPLLVKQYLDMLGLAPMPEKTPLHTTVTGTVDRDTITIEKLHFQSVPGLYVTGNLYRPKTIKGKLPAILYVCGHSGRGRDGNKTAFQDHGMWFARNGYVCLIIDTLQLGEVAGKHHGTYNLNRFWWQSHGYTSAGVECWNGIRAIDYLVSRPDVDAEKIGVTGISGGGAVTIWIAAADPRVKVAVPVSGMSDLESYVGNRVINGHCDCMFVINTYGWEWTTIAALIAPRPMLFANSDMDPIFPMDGNRRIIERLRKIYSMYGKGNVVDDYVSKGGHDYRPDLRLAIFGFINKHLKGDTSPIVDASDPALPGMQLRVFPTDDDLPNDSKNAVIDESFVPQAIMKSPPADFGVWKNDIVRQLRDRPFRSLPLLIADAEPIGDPEGVLQPFTSEQPVRHHLISLVPDKGQKQGTLLVLNPDDAILEVTRTWAKPFVDDRIVYAVLPRGAIPSKWERKNPPNYVERAHALEGSTVDTGRVRDVIATARWARERFGDKIQWRVVARGQAGVIITYAAIFESSISEVVIVDPVTSYREGPHFLSVGRVIDVPDAMGLLAPRPLTLVGGTDKAFDRTAAIYQAAKARDKFLRE